MYVCLCKGVTEKDISQQVDMGCCSMRELKSELGVATQCGRCACHAQAVLKQSMANKNTHLLQSVKSQNPSKTSLFYSAASF